MQQRARVPMFWPAAWSVDAGIKLLESSPVNCLIAEPEAETQARQAAEAKGIEFLPLRWTSWAETDWSRAAPFAISDGVWPGAAASRNQQEGGPTGAFSDGITLPTPATTLRHHQSCMIALSG